MAMRIDEALDQARRLAVERLDAQLLLVHVLTNVDASPAVQTEITRSWLLAHNEQLLTPGQQQAWQAVLARRAEGLPLAYAVGEQVFCGLKLQVSPAVLIPRPETEELVRWALECLATRLQSPQRQSPPRVLDLGTGSGAVALAIKHRCSAAQVHATDISPAALQVAMTNAQKLHLDLGFGLADWWTPSPAPKHPVFAAGGLAAPSGRFDLVVSNPPYIVPGDEHLPALRHEPVAALVGAETDGLGDLRAIIDGSRGRLQPGAWLLLEHGHDQAQALQELLLRAGYHQPQTRADLAGLPRCTGARWP